MSEKNEKTADEQMPQTVAELEALIKELVAEALIQAGRTGGLLRQ